MKQLNVKTYCLGMWQTNSYVITQEDSDKCWIIDAGFEPEKMIKEIIMKKLNPEFLIYTHSHLDHIAGTEAVREAFPEIKTGISEDEADFLGDPAKNLSAMSGMNVSVGDADFTLKDQQEIKFNDLVFKVISTPGHSPGGICLYQKESDLLLCGDTLFQGSVGRYDFPTSDGEALFKSIKEKLLVLPDKTEVLPGHGAATTIGIEKSSNPFL